MKRIWLFLLMVSWAMALGHIDARVKVGVVAALLAFFRPYPIYFAIEDKSYAFWFWRFSSVL